MSEDAANHTDVSIAGDDASEEAPQKAPAWGPDTRALLEGWRFRVTRAQFGHQLAADKTRRWHFVLGVPIVILTTIVGTSAFAAIGDSPSTFWKILAGTVSLLAAVLASVQTFLGYGERSERHRIAATRYANTRRSIDLTLVNHQAASIPFIKGEMDRTGGASPQLDRQTWDDARLLAEEAIESGMDLDHPGRNQPAKRSAPSVKS